MSYDFFIVSHATHAVSNWHAIFTGGRILTLQMTSRYAIAIHGGKTWLDCYR
ncbi:hypothetical protein SAMN05446935_7895 [Burkholderia sp. YR290]|nr:hypothetical protein SAMN05446935_7895 [Burkholderia sp. YR290]